MRGKGEEKKTRVFHFPDLNFIIGLKKRSCVFFFFFFFFAARIPYRISVSNSELEFFCYTRAVPNTYYIMHNTIY